MKTIILFLAKRLAESALLDIIADLFIELLKKCTDKAEDELIKLLRKAAEKTNKWTWDDKLVNKIEKALKK